MKCTECGHEMSLEEKVTFLENRIDNLEHELQEERSKALPYVPYYPASSYPQPYTWFTTNDSAWTTSTKIRGSVTLKPYHK